MKKVLLKRYLHVIGIGVCISQSITILIIMICFFFNKKKITIAETNMVIVLFEGIGAIISILYCIYPYLRLFKYKK